MWIQATVRRFHRRHKGRNRCRVGGVRGTNLNARTDERTVVQTGKVRIILLDKATLWANVLAIFSNAPAHRRPLDTERRRRFATTSGSLLLVERYMRQGGLVLAVGRVRSKKYKRKKTNKICPAQNTPRYPQPPGDRDQLETACGEARLTG